MKLIFAVVAMLAASFVSARVDVVTSNALAADWVQQVGGKQVSVTALAGRGTDPHHFSPTPRQFTALAKADLIVAFGQGLEPWLADAMQASGTKAKLLLLTDNLDLMAFGERYWEDQPVLYPNASSKPPCCREDAEQANIAWAAMIPKMPSAGHDHHDHDHHGHSSEGDPHVWLDPQLALLMVLEINDALNELAPGYADYFDQRREKYLNELLELDAWAEAQFAGIPVRRRILITYHDNLRYLGRRYGLFAPVSILGSVTTESADPSAKQFSNLLKVIRELGAPAVFVDATGNPRLAEQVAREASLPPPVVIYTGSLTAEDGLAPDYLSLMRANVSAITNALR